METKRGTASKRLSLDLSIENNYPNFTRERGSYFFAFLSMMTRSNLITILNNDMINVKQADYSHGQAREVLTVKFSL